MNILVLDGRENQAVACARSLGRAGHRVVIGATSPWAKASWSRYCRGRFSYPGPDQDCEAFVSRVVEEVRSNPGALVLPMTERTTLPLSAEREKVFAAGGCLVLPPHETIVRAFDKLQTTELARSFGLETPQTVLIRPEDDPDDVCRSLHLPAVLKPRSSEEVLGGKTHSTGAPRYARTPAEFREALTELRQRCDLVLAQEFVEGEGIGWFALMRHGELRAEFAHRRIRDVRPTGSGSALRVSVLPDPRVREAGLSILRALGWHGVAMVEFRRRPDGTPVFLEVNGRFWNSLALALHAGVDFPGLLARLSDGEDVPPGNGYRTGVHCRWLVGDFRHLVEVLKGPPAGYPGKFPRRLATLRSFVTPTPSTHYDNFELLDPLPEVIDWFDFLFCKVLGRVASKLRLL